MEEGKILYQGRVEKIFERLRKDGITNVLDRYRVKSIKDGGGKDSFSFADGVMCNLCTLGPCSASVEEEKRGVCGITVEGMAMREILINQVMAASSYKWHTYDTLRTFRVASEDRSLFKVKELEKLRAFGLRFNIPDILADDEIAHSLYTHVLSDFSNPFDYPSYIVQTLAPKERITRWKELGIFPGGITAEIVFALSSCFPNADGYYRSLAKKSLRLSIATVYQSHLITEYLQDILFGTPKPHKVNLDLGVLNPDYVNVILNGREPFLGFAMIELARRKEWQERAKIKGALGLRVIGNAESGKEMIQRYEMDEVFAGYVGNCISQEAILGSGCIDLFACDMDSSMPVDPLYAKKYKFKLVLTTPIVAFDGVGEKIEYFPYEIEKQASLLLDMAIENFLERRRNVEPVTGLPVQEMIAGFSVESILEIMGGTPDPLVKGIMEGRISGISGVVFCPRLKDSGQDLDTVGLLEELIRNNILVFLMGCGNCTRELATLCSEKGFQMAGEGLRSVCEYFGIPPVLSFGTSTDMGRFADLLGALSAYLKNVNISDLPVVVCVPEHLDQRAIVDAMFALALGIHTCVNPRFFAKGVPNLAKFFSEELEEITGGKLYMESDRGKIIKEILDHLSGKRIKLGAKR